MQLKKGVANNKAIEKFEQINELDVRFSMELIKACGYEVVYWQQDEYHGRFVLQILCYLEEEHAYAAFCRDMKNENDNSVGDNTEDALWRPIRIKELCSWVRRWL